MIYGPELHIGKNIENVKIFPLRAFKYLKLVILDFSNVSRQKLSDAIWKFKFYIIKIECNENISTDTLIKILGFIGSSSLIYEELEIFIDLETDSLDVLLMIY